MMGMAALNPLETLVMQGSALALLGLGMHIRVGSDGDASQTGFLFFASWTYLMRNAGGVMSGTMFQVSTLVNTLMAVAMARRQGGLWKTMTSLDTVGITSVLPRNDAINVRNVVGIQCLFWGLIGMFQSGYLFNTIMGATGPRGAAAVCSGSAHKWSGVVALGARPARPLSQSALRRKEQPSVSRALPPVGWQSIIEQDPQSTVVCAWLNTVVMLKQPGHFTSMKNELGDCTSRLSL